MPLLVVHEETINVELPNVGKAPSCLYVQLAALHYGNGLHVLGGIVGNELAKEQGRPNLLIKHKSKDMTPDLRRELELMRFISARSAGRGGSRFWLACLYCAGGAFLARSGTTTNAASAISTLIGSILRAYLSCLALAGRRHGWISAVSCLDLLLLANSKMNEVAKGSGPHDQRIPAYRSVKVAKSKSHAWLQEDIDKSVAKLLRSVHWVSSKAASPDT